MVGSNRQLLIVGGYATLPPGEWPDAEEDGAGGHEDEEGRSGSWQQGLTWQG
jgi:hypothetical protein